MPRILRALAVSSACSLATAVASEPAAAGIWTEIPSGTTQNITAIEYQSPARFWFTTAAGAIYTRRPDGSFTLTRSPSGVPLNDIEFQAGGPIGLAVGNGGQVLRSVDAGATWSAVTRVAVSNRSCTAREPLGDVNAVRFAGATRAWILGAGSQIATSQQPLGMVGATGTWVDANTVHDTGCKLPYGAYADAFFVPSNPDVGYFVASRHPWASVYFTVNNLVSAAALKPTDIGTFSPGRVIAGDPVNPTRMWSADAGAWATTGYTRDGWQTSSRWTIGNHRARTYEPPADVDYADGTVLAAGTAGVVLNSIDGETFYYNSADGALETQRWTAVGLADATQGAIGGDNGKLAITSQANVIPVTVTPTPTPSRTPAPTPTPTPTPVAGRSWTSGTVTGRVLVKRRGRTVVLSSGQSVPLNTTVDARHGTITITVAVNTTTGARQTATLAKGIFRVAQRRRGTTAATSITLQTPSGKSRACAKRPRPPKGIVRTLNGSVKGSFAIVGKAATATVRDASWTVQDTCSGTRTKNERGTVTVKAKASPRAVTVRPGRSYLAKARLFAARKRGPRG